MNAIEILNNVRIRCINEIKWIEGCQEEMDIPDNTYTEKDKAWFVAYKVAHEKILEVITRGQE